MDPWGPLNGGDMLDVAHMGAHVGQMAGHDQLQLCFKAVTENPARALGLEGYGLNVGCHGDLVVLQADSPSEAIRNRPSRLLVVRRGRVIAEGPRMDSRLSLPGRPATTDFARKTKAPAALMPR